MPKPIIAAATAAMLLAACRKTTSSQPSGSARLYGSTSGHAPPPPSYAAASTDRVPYACSWDGSVRYPRRTLHVTPAGKDTNTGESETQAYASLQKAADEAAPGDTVLVHGGVYAGSGNGEAVVRIHRSGAPDAPVVFRAAPGTRPRIESRAWHGIQVDEASYVVIEGFELAGPAADTPMEFATAHSNDPREAITNGDGVHLWNYKTGGHSHHVILRDNLVHHFGASGIFLAQFDCVSLLRNRVHSNSWHTVYGTSGINAWRPENLVQSDGYRLVINGNKVFDNENLIPWIDAKPVPKLMDGGNGIIVDLTTMHGYTGRTLIANNVTYRNGGAGIYAFSAEHVDVVNNVGYRNGRGRAVDLGEVVAQKSKDVHFRNNILAASPGLPVTTNRDNESISYDHNLYSGGGAIAVRGPHDREADPGFADVSGEHAGNGVQAGHSDRNQVGERGWDFHLRAGSPAIDSGVRFAYVSADIEGRERPQGSGVDMGAYEHPVVP